MKFFRFTLSLLALSLGMGVFNVCAAQDRDRWDAVPHEFREFQRQGFRDGLSAAQQDFDLHRRPDVNIHEEFRHPHTPPNMASDYKDGFRRGFDSGVRHLFPNGLNGAMPWDRPAERHDDRVIEHHDAGPRDNSNYRRMGYNDGLIGAQKDFDNHRRPDVNNRDEFRHPSVPLHGADEYREGFRNGYADGVRNDYPGGVPSVMPWEHSTARWDEVPNEYNESRRRGFHDGMEAAQHDFDAQRRPDAQHHERFVHPGVPFQIVEEYREGFRRGYEMATSHLYPNGIPAFFPGEQPPPPPPPPPSPWMSIPRQSAQMQKVGYLDGILAAGQDYQAGMAPSVESHPEYHSSKLSFLVRVLYKAGYKTGYDLASHNFADRIEGTSSPVQQRGFLDGVAAVRQDYDAKRRPDMNIHPEYNNPQVDPNRQDEYREAYRRGFDVAAGYLY